MKLSLSHENRDDHTDKDSQRAQPRREEDTLIMDGILRESSQQKRAAKGRTTTSRATSRSASSSRNASSIRSASSAGKSSRTSSGSGANAGRKAAGAGRASGNAGRTQGSTGRKSSDTRNRTGTSAGRAQGSSTAKKSSKSSVSFSTGKTPNANYRQVSKQEAQRAKKTPSGQKQPPKKKKKRGCSGCLIPLLLFLIVLVAAFFFGYRFLRASFAKIENYALDRENVTAMTNDDAISNYQNIALFGVDNQDNVINDTGSRTDCIIIASINKSTKAVKLMSIYRDTYVSIDGEYDKINAAYSYGGPELALRTINRNLDLNVTDFVTVNFKALADAVDVLGGIPLTINSEKELDNLNDYIGNMNKINGGDSPKFDSTGTYTFDGNQAVAYARIRYMEGGDHARASHQRLVLEGIANAAKAHPLKAVKLIDTVLPQCKTSLSGDAMTKLSLSLPRYKIADSQAYPFDSEDERYGGIYYGFPTTAAENAKQAHEYLFGSASYEPSEELSRISEKIKVVTDDIGITD